MSDYRVRFAPSPTGPLHIGGARSALFNYLLAKKNKGDFILRMEDTDLKRSGRASELNIMESLSWLGIDWNEGIERGGDFAPYRQTERLSTYGEAALRLIESAHAYYCYCTPEELEKERAELIAAKETPRYLGRCRNLSLEERKEREANGIRPSVRFRIPADTDIVFDDQVRGRVTFSAAEIGGDFIIVKSDGIPTYNFAVVVDDYLMKISHVIRAEEHLSNTPRQLLLCDALQYPRPVFGHISLILGEDKTKMSKRHGKVSVLNYREMGFMPEAVVNYLALLGWSPEGERELFTLKELEESFSLERVSKSPAVFDLNKLSFFNARYLRNLDDTTLGERLKEFLGDSPAASFDTERLTWLAAALKNHLETFADVREYLPLFENRVIDPVSDDAAAVLREDNAPLVLCAFADELKGGTEWTPEGIKGRIKDTQKATGIKGAGLYMPIRVALTGAAHGPEIDRLTALMGREIALMRLSAALSAL